MSYSILYYTANKPQKELADYVRECIDESREPSSQTVCVTHSRIGWGNVEIVRGTDVVCGLADQYDQILIGLEACEHDTVFLAEDDVLYPPGHFAWRANGRYVLSYNYSMARMNKDGFWLDPRMIDSGCCGQRQCIKDAAQFKKGQSDQGERIRWSELGSESPQARNAERHNTPIPFIDVRWGGNLTGYREARPGYYLDKLPHWGNHTTLAHAMGLKEIGNTQDKE